MNREIKGLFYSVFIASIALVLGYFALGHCSNFIGWNGYEKWKHRVRTDSISESKKRLVFVKTLQYKIIDAQNLKNFHFTPYIEKGFRFGRHSKNETILDTFTKYPYNLSYEQNKKDSVTLHIINYEKLDSCDAVWGYLKSAQLKDTIIIEIDGSKNSKGEELKGIIKVW